MAHTAPPLPPPLLLAVGPIFPPMPARCTAVQPTVAATVQPRSQQHAAPPPLPQPQQCGQQRSAGTLQLQRRQLLGSMLGSCSLAVLQPASAWAEAPATEAAAGTPKPGSLAARIATQGSVQQPGIQPPWAPKQLFYPRYMFGEWQARLGDEVGSGLNCNVQLCPAGTSPCLMNPPCLCPPCLCTPA